MPFPIALAASLLPAIYQGIMGIGQKKKASELQESKFIPPELLMNRDLAKNQAYSRRAPGAAIGESLNRRTMANQISAGMRVGGDSNKLAAITAGAGAQLNDANARIGTMGQQFSEGAFGRLSNANLGIAQQKRQNRDEYNRAKESLLYSSDQNIFNSINNIASAGLTGYLNGDFNFLKGAGKEARIKFREQKAAGNEVGGELGSLIKKEARQDLRTARKTARNGLVAGPLDPGQGKMPTITSNPWADYMGNQAMRNYGFDPYNWQQQQYQQGGVWRMPGYTSPQYNMNGAPRMRMRMSSRKPY